MDDGGGIFGIYTACTMCACAYAYRTRPYIVVHRHCAPITPTRSRSNMYTQHVSPLFCAAAVVVAALLARKTNSRTHIQSPAHQARTHAQFVHHHQERKHTVQAAAAAAVGAARARPACVCARLPTAYVQRKPRAFRSDARMVGGGQRSG